MVQALFAASFTLTFDSNDMFSHLTWFIYKRAPAAFRWFLYDLFILHLSGKLIYNENVALRTQAIQRSLFSVLGLAVVRCVKLHLKISYQVKLPNLVVKFLCQYTNFLNLHIMFNLHQMRRMDT